MIKENTNMIKLLDAIGLHYDIVVNKFDNIEEDEQEQFRTKIKQEIKDIGLKGIDHFFLLMLSIQLCSLTGKQWSII